VGARWRSLMTVDWKHDRHKESAAAIRADILDRLAPSLADAQLEGARSAARSYRRLSTNYRRRRELYSTASKATWLRRWAALAAGGGYRQMSRGGLGGRNGLRDLARGVLYSNPVALGFEEEHSR
jgi:hypothetical protein